MIYYVNSQVKSMVLSRKPNHVTEQGNIWSSYGVGHMTCIVPCQTKHSHSVSEHTSDYIHNGTMD